MGIADEIAKLQELHQSGALSDAEFAEAKRSVLNANGPQDVPRVDPALAAAANRYVDYVNAKEHRRQVGNVVRIVWAIVVIIVFVVIVTSVMSGAGSAP